MRAAVNLFPDHIEKLPCAGHRINLCANDLFKITNIKEDIKNNIRKFHIYEYNENDELRKVEINLDRKNEIELSNTIKTTINKIINKCKHLASSFHHSESLARKLKEKQEELQLEKKIKLIQCVPTRWNSQLDMIDSILINKDPLLSLSIDRANYCIKNYIPTENEFIILTQLSLLLQPLKELTNIFSGQSYNTISLLYPCIQYLLNDGLDEVNLDCYEIIHLRLALKFSLGSRFRYMFNNNLFIAATFLNYKYRKFEFIANEFDRKKALNDAKCYIISKFNSENNISSPQLLSSSNSPLANATNTNINSSLPIAPATPTTTKQNKSRISFLEKIKDKTPIRVTRVMSDIETEISNYEEHNFVLGDEQDSEEDSSLLFFKINCKQYNNLVRVVKNILSIPITSVPAESLFSHTGNTLSYLRTSMNSTNLESCVFYKLNKISFF